MENAKNHREWSSPRAWGCFSCVPCLLCLSAVFPTCVGVFPFLSMSASRKSCLPHVRGGVSFVYEWYRYPIQSSPRAWGCFSRIEFCTSRAQVFPTCVGVFPVSSPPPARQRSLPHVRGGVSLSDFFYWPFAKSSPRAWGCFCARGAGASSEDVFPTCVGVFLTMPPCTGFLRSLPHVRGGVSLMRNAAPHRLESSPRAWGCFQLSTWAYRGTPVFPTCVGVFLARNTADTFKLCLPHVRGGVSKRWTE